VADDIVTLLGEINKKATPPPLNTSEKVLGFARSALAGPTFNFGENLEAGMFAPFTDKTYEQELSDIRAQQALFKQQYPVTGTTTEIAASLANPLQVAGKAKYIRAIPQMLEELPAIGKTASFLLTNPASQAALAGAGAANGQDVFSNAALSGLVGGGLAAGANLLGRGLETAGLQADRFKLSAYGIGKADLTKQLKKLGSSAETLGESASIPLVQTVKELESRGTISAENPVLTNVKNILDEQSVIGNKLGGILSQADGVSEIAPDFALTRTQKYINSFKGDARNKAQDAAQKEVTALLEQIGEGKVTDLQSLKVGLNYRFDDNPYAEDAITAIRSDLRAEIEKRVDAASKAGTLPEVLAGQVKSLNQEYGKLAEAKKVFVSKAHKDLGGNAIEDFFRSQATTGGQGSANIMSATTGNLGYAAAGLAANAARMPAALSKIGDITKENQPWLVPLGKGIKELGTARVFSQGLAGSGKQPPKAEETPVTSQDIQSLLAAINAKSAATPAATPTPQAPAAQPIGYTPGQQPRLFDAVYNTKKLQTSMDMGSADRLVNAVINTESAQNVSAVSPKGAQGLMQLMPDTGREVMKKLGMDPTKYDPFNPKLNVLLGTTYLQEQLDHFGSEDLALAAYNAGPGAVGNLIKKYGNSFEAIRAHLPKETQDYVKKVLAQLQPVGLLEV
jgi:hypothetical protein